MRHIVSFFSLFLCLNVNGQEIDMDSELSKLTPFMLALYGFSNAIPQEKVYLHFDNTSYYQGDDIWFKCYVVTAGLHQLSDLSKTLYVELLNPGGEVVVRRILKIENGQCHGDFTLNQLPFYSGFYEVRAYTKYMLNFGDDVIFSRLLPVFNKPETEGNFEEKEMLNYGRWVGGNMPMKRERPEKGKALNVRFFPEGGNPVQGVTSRFAFEATDAFGNPVDVTGTIFNAAKQEIGRFAVAHEGRGVFRYTPATGKGKDFAAVEYDGRKYQFDMPAGLPQGVVMETDNLSYPDSIGVTLRKNSNTPDDMFGIAVMSGGKVQDYCVVLLVEEDETGFRLDKKRLPSGVSQIVLFNRAGEIVCDRLVFIQKNDQRVNIKVKTDKPAYRPYEPVEMEVSMTDGSAMPVATTFSMSVRDGANGVENNHSVLTELLLMSEIKGYVRNPSWYFEDKNDMVETRRATSLLDLLLMVQGWRRYSWNQMAGIEPFELKYQPEQGIETNGSVVGTTIRGRQIPKSGVDVSLLFHQRAENVEAEGSMVEHFLTDSLGRFSFVLDIKGRNDMILAVHEKGKPKNYKIMLERVFNPALRKYRYVDLQVNRVENNPISDDDIESYTENDDSLYLAWQDSLTKSGLDEKVISLNEVTVKAKRRTRERDIFQNRSTSIAYYDASSELEKIFDSGDFTGNDIQQFLTITNNNFAIKRNEIVKEESLYGKCTIYDVDNPFLEGNMRPPLKKKSLTKTDIRNCYYSLQHKNVDFLLYKNKMTLFVINYQPVVWLPHPDKYFKYTFINVSAIKSIYINENPAVIAQYIESPNIAKVNPQELALHLGCVVFIETYPDGEMLGDAGKGNRKTHLEGYSPVKAFYSPDYSSLPQESDYRRTLYWNPMITTDDTGLAKVSFYNNSNCKNFSISAETITPHGKIGVFLNRR